MKPKLSICCLTFNHAKFIRQALDGFVMQKTNFPFEVLIHDDASTDGTADIIREYEAKFPDIIKPIYQTENQYSKGVAISKTFNFPRIQGEYVAMCEGDDYWTDPLKLQKQVDFLDAHPECSMCFHDAMEIWDDDPERRSMLPRPELMGDKTFLTDDDLFKIFAATASTVFRWVFHKQVSLDSWPENIINGDTYLYFQHAQFGKIGYIPETMSVYRHHAGGIWQGHPFAKNIVKSINLWDHIEKMNPSKYHKRIYKLKRDCVLTAYRQCVFENNFTQFKALGLPIPKIIQKIIYSRFFTSFLRAVLPDADSGFRILQFNRLVMALGYVFNIRWVEKRNKDV